MTTFLSVIFALVSILLILIVLIQRGRGGGLVGAFGAGGGGSAFGTKTGDVFTSVTVVFFVLFLLLSIILNWRVQPRTRAATTTAPAQKQPVSATTPKTSQMSKAGGKAATHTQAPIGSVTPAITSEQPQVKTPAINPASRLHKTTATTSATKP